MRTLTSPSAGATIIDKLKTYEGGTGQVTAAAVLAAMNAVPLTQMGVPGGLLALDANGKMPANSLPIDKVSTVAVVGPMRVFKNTLSTYTIGNYDAFTTYSVVAISGVVAIVNDVIQYQAPSTAQAGGFTINGRLISIPVDDYKPNAPVLAGVDGFGSPATLTLTGSTYSVNAGSGTHLNSDWQIATDAAFTNVVKSSMADAVNKTTYSNGTVSASTTYYSRVRYRDNLGTVGDWSNVITIITKASYVISKEEAKLLAGDPAVSDRFGWSVSISADGNRVVISAYNKAGTAGGSQGVVYIFTRSGVTWTQEAKLLASDPGNSDYFGISVSITADGSRVAIGAYTKTGTYTGQGATYIFLRTGVTWTQEAKLLTSDPAGNDWFGYSVSITGDGSRVVIGAYYKTGAAGSAQGAAYVFLRTGTTWAQEAKLLASDPANGDYFGNSVSITADGSRVVVGAYGKTGLAGGSQGAIYIFTRAGTTWGQEAKRFASDAAAQDSFGGSVSITGDGSRVVIGAWNKTGSAGTYQGAVYIFLRTGTTWAQEAKLLASDPGASSNFGNSVSISADGNRAVIGAYYKSGPAGGGQGAVYIFTCSGASWTQESKLLASDPSGSDNFGTSVSISPDGSRVAIGAYNKTGSAGTYQGAVYIET